MSPPSAAALGNALRTATQANGVTQKAIAAAVKRDQSTVSAWLNGENWAPLWTLPIIDALCGQPKGHVLRLAGFVDDENGGDVLSAIAQDPHLGEDGRASVTQVYGVFRKRWEASNTASAQPDAV